ncbi:hypothetical protein SK069_09240 [Patulibacter brassicae]|uniref:Uncharacterized protein n=1 Tax=Patulibacter brassicae TaxID=1705717 RepID=A0ABU4VIW7_9ACTN|nr:hypothetical protein [Patulibacter brassicae]MDX8151776.1 hypothetical protein [Patulibacter brassicae]
MFPPHTPAPVPVRAGHRPRHRATSRHCGPRTPAPDLPLAATVDADAPSAVEWLPRPRPDRAL